MSCVNEPLKPTGFSRGLLTRVMTISPQPPSLEVVPHKEGLMELAEPHLTFVDLGLGFSLMVLLKKGFQTDGATVPKEDLEDSKIARKICKFIAKHYPGKNYKETLDYLIGTPFEMPRLLAAIVHDALYGLHWKCRWLCDRVYRKILENQNYDRIRLEIEYLGIRLLGWKNWKAVTTAEKHNTRRLAEVKIVLTKNVQKISNRLVYTEDRDVHSARNMIAIRDMVLSHLNKLPTEHREVTLTEFRASIGGLTAPDKPGRGSEKMPAL